MGFPKGVTGSSKGLFVPEKELLVPKGYRPVVVYQRYRSLEKLKFPRECDNPPGHVIIHQVMIAFLAIHERI